MNKYLDVVRMKEIVIGMEIVRVVLFVGLTIVWKQEVPMHSMMKRMTAVKDAANQIIRARRVRAIVSMIQIVVNHGCSVVITTVRTQTIFHKKSSFGII